MKTRTQGKLLRYLLAGFAAWALLLAPSGADPVPLGSDDFASGAEGWISQETVGAGTHETIQQGTRGGRDEVLLFGLETWGGTIPEQDYIGETYGTGGENDDIVGAITNTGSVFFDFYADADAGGDGGGTTGPGGLFLYFETEDGDIWYYDVLAAEGMPTLADWYTYAVDVDYDQGGWDSDTRSGGTEFQDDLASVTNAGVWVVYQDWDAQEYALDDVEVYDVPVAQVPLPPTLALYLTGLLVLAVRRKLRG